MPTSDQISNKACRYPDCDCEPPCNIEHESEGSQDSIAVGCIREFGDVTCAEGGPQTTREYSYERALVLTFATEHALRKAIHEGRVKFEPSGAPPRNADGEALERVMRFLKRTRKRWVDAGAPLTTLIDIDHAVDDMRFVIGDETQQDTKEKA